MELETEPSGEGEEKAPDELTFPVNDASLTAVRAESIREAVKQVQNLQDRYVDYSQVKAILWDVSLRNEPELAEEILEWLESSPSFARNILVFRISSEELTLGEVQEQSRGQAGLIWKICTATTRIFRRMSEPWRRCCMCRSGSGERQEKTWE